MGNVPKKCNITLITFLKVKGMHVFSTSCDSSQVEWQTVCVCWKKLCWLAGFSDIVSYSASDWLIRGAWEQTTTMTYDKGEVNLRPPPTHTHTHMHTQNRGHTHISHILKGFSEAFHNMIAMVISREEHSCADTQMVHLMALLWLLQHKWSHQRLKHGSGLTKLGVSTTQLHQLISGLE